MLLDPEFGVIQPVATYGQFYRGKVRMLFFDGGDQLTLLMRSDYLNDPAEKDAFNKRFGYTLDKPKT